MQAALAESGLFKHLKNSSSQSVAKYGYKQLFEGKVVAVHGITNKLLVFLSKIMPRKLVRTFTYYIQK